MEIGDGRQRAVIRKMSDYIEKDNPKVIKTKALVEKK